jgi:predicted patatin/cPLA2 family phospholipase
MSTLLELLTKHRAEPDSKRVFGLVVQGGGMRAVYSAAVLSTFIEYGLTEVFDHVVGSSAGGMNGAYFIAGQAEAVDVYTDDLTTKKFVNLARLNKKVDIDYVIDVALRQNTPLRIDKLESSRSKLHLVLTSETTSRRVVISDHQQFKEIYEELRATSALPILYDKIVPVGNGLYVDGGVADLLPVDVAVGLGCTDIIVIMTRKVSSYHFDARHTRLARSLMYHLARGHSKELRKMLPTNERILGRNLRLLTSPPKGTRIHLLEPSNEEMLVTLGTTDKGEIEELAKLGVSDTESFLHNELSSN